MKLKYIMALTAALFCCPFMGQIREVQAQTNVVEYNQEEFNEVVDIYKELRDIELEAIEYLDGTALYVYHHNDIMKRYSWVLDYPETIYDAFDPEEIEKIAKVVEAETSGSDFKSKTNVASVIFNRLKSDKFPNDIIGVLEQKNQFASTNKEVSDDTICALEYAYTIEDPTNGALWFNMADCNSWASRNREYIFTDKAGHEFYK